MFARKFRNTRRVAIGKIFDIVFQTTNWCTYFFAKKDDSKFVSPVAMGALSHHTRDFGSCSRSVKILSVSNKALLFNLNNFSFSVGTICENCPSSATTRIDFAQSVIEIFVSRKIGILDKTTNQICDQIGFGTIAKNDEAGFVSLFAPDLPNLNSSRFFQKKML